MTKSGRMRDRRGGGEYPSVTQQSPHGARSSAGQGDDGLDVLAARFQQMIFVNPPVQDVKASRAFFTGLGYTLNPQFSTDECACVVISDTMVAMMLSEKHYRQFTDKTIADSAASGVLLCLSAESREPVDELVDRALSPGGTATGSTQDMGVMYGCAPSTTRTGTPGRSCGWIRRRCRAEQVAAVRPGDSFRSRCLAWARAADF